MTQPTPPALPAGLTRAELTEAYHNAPHRPAPGGSLHTGVEAVALLVAERLAAGQRTEDPQRDALLELLRAVRATHWRHDEPGPRHPAHSCKKCAALSGTDIDTLIEWVATRTHR